MALHIFQDFTLLCKRQGKDKKNKNLISFEFFCKKKKNLFMKCFEFYFTIENDDDDPVNIFALLLE